MEDKRPERANNHIPGERATDLGIRWMMQISMRCVLEVESFVGKSCQVSFFLVAWFGLHSFLSETHFYYI
jgi:hypothetical protein